MEYVVVSYPIDRDVRVDERVAGTTNDTLMMERGHHRFDLGNPPDYEPPSVDKEVQNTTAVTPLVIIDFMPSGGVV